MLIAAVIYMLTDVYSWAELSAFNFYELVGLMVPPLFFAGLCTYLLSMLKCRPPDASKRIET